MLSEARMFLDEIVPLDIPTAEWMDRVEVGDWIWLVKENEPAHVVWAWLLDKPYYIDDSRSLFHDHTEYTTAAACRRLIIPYRGRIAIDRTWRDGERWGTKCQQTWSHIDLRGRGLDGKPLFAPTKEYFDFIGQEPASEHDEIDARFGDLIHEHFVD
jgi:hypothetical protein